MNLVFTIDQYDDDDVYFCDGIKNNIMSEGKFIRILYSNSLLVMNGINLLITLNDVSVEQYYNKYRCTFNANNHRHVVESIRQIEEDLLKKYQNTVNDSYKKPVYKISDNFRMGNIKLFLDSPEKLPMTFMLKISGVWETETQYGLTYKFLKANNP